MASGETSAAHEQQVQSMFDRIAGHYDVMNSVMSAGLHHRWRARAADLSELKTGDRAIDLCCGTGDLAFELKRRVGPDGEVVGLDFSEQMLELANRKAAQEQLPVSFIHGNALDLPFKDDYFDAATVGFGVRNLADLDGGIAEMARVVKPGGRVVILEITTPQHAPMSWFYSVWFDQIVPLLGSAAGDPDAYSYLPESVRRFPEAQELAARMDGLGLRAIRYIMLAGGIVALHVGTVPATSR